MTVPSASALRELTAAAAGAGRRTLVRGGHVVSMDERLGDFVGDVLIEDEKIVALGPELTEARAGGDVIELDATGSIVAPGFVDSHLHAWQGQLAGVAPDVSLPRYEEVLHGALAPHYRPEDMRIGNLVSALRCLESGVTCVIDNSHNARSAEHSSAAVEGLREAGIRAVHATGTPIEGEWNRQWAADLARLRAEYFGSDEQLLTLRLYTAKPAGQRQAWEFARQEGYWVSTEVGFWNEAFIRECAADGVLTSRHAFNHCAGLSEELWRLIADHGIAVNVCARSDTTFFVGPAMPPVAEALAHGVPVGMSMDTEASYGIDFFAEMGTLLHLARGRAASAPAEDRVAPTARDVLTMATRGGAANAGLVDRIGSLTPGKQADLVVIKPGSLAVGLPRDPAAAITSFSRPADVAAVFVAGRLRKWDGELQGHDLAGLKREAEASRERLLANTTTN
ncbi:MAG: amidohydrolase family protein [Actinobacteria bacterium]|nr:amidohydrolase family protein [Actinomycetota bacterium]